MGSVIIRDATDADVPAMTGIYNAWIPTLTITWTETPQTEDECAAWLASQREHGFPVLVAEDAGEVVGYTGYEHFRGEGKWPGYRATVEHTIHVLESHWGRGVGRALMEALIERARAAGVHAMIGAVDSENVASIQFHEGLGFSQVARMPEIGQKFGRWLHLILMQRILDSRDRP